MMYRVVKMSLVAFCLAAVYGCGTSGSSGSGRASSKPAATDNDIRYDYIDETKLESVGKHNPVAPSTLSLQKILEHQPFNYGAFSSDDAETLRRNYEHLAITYQKSASKELPPLDVLVKASYFSAHPESGEAVYEIDHKGFNASHGVRRLVAAIARAGRFVESGKSVPTFLRHQNYLQKTSDQMWTVHKSVMHSVRRPSRAGLQFQELNENAPMLADASGNQVLGLRLEEGNWYFYGQGYAFRGHWQPDESRRQDYRGEGAEFGLFKTMANGFLLGGLLGLQKVRMEADTLKSEAEIYRTGPFLSWSDDAWTVDAMLTYGWAKLDTGRKDFLNNHWSGSSDGNEWAAHVQTSYAIALDQWLMGLQWVPEAYLGYRTGTLGAYREIAGDEHFLQGEEQHKGLTAKLGSGLRYTFPDLSQPAEFGIKLGVQKTHGWQEQKNDSRSAFWPKTPEVESRETALYYGLHFSRMFGAELDKLIGLEFNGTSGDKSGSEMLTFTYRQKF